MNLLINQRSSIGSFLYVYFTNKTRAGISLHTCTAAICDTVKQSADGAIQAITEFIMKRGNQLNESDISRTTQSLLSATVFVIDKHSHQEILNAISCSNVFFNEVLAFAGRDIVTKDVSRLRGGWPMHDAFCRGENTSHNFESLNDEDILQAVVLALTVLFRGGGKTGKKAVEQSYSSVFSVLTLQLGSCLGLTGLSQHQRLQYMRPY